MSNKITAIGNAITDIVCEVDDKFLEENLLIKGSMSLIDLRMADKLSALKSVKITSGGSASNTVAAISQLGAKSSLIGKVALDNFGRKFIDEIQKTGVKFTSKRFSHASSAKSFILVTPDAQRTMCTFLGCASEIFEEDIDEEAIKNSEILYLEGYLWDQDTTIEALKKAITLAKKHSVKIAFTLSDFFCVSRHKDDFIELIKNDLDILFANEAEMQELLDIKDIEGGNFTNLHDFFAQNPKLIAAVTRSEKGCVIFENNNHTEVKAEQINELVDTTGAGDCFAAGFLFGIDQNYPLEKAAWLGNSLASKIIQKFGARFEKNEI